MDRHQDNAADPRFNSSSSMISLYPDGLNRINNDLRDWLDGDQNRLPKGPFGVDAWIDNQATVSRVKELYSSTEESSQLIEGKRKVFLIHMGQIKEAMVISEDKNVYVEPIT